jgi:hypothetical protein
MEYFALKQEADYKASAFAVSPPSLQDPIYTKNDRTTSNKPMIINGGGTHAIQVTFSGYGNAKGTNYTDSGLCN